MGALVGAVQAGRPLAGRLVADGRRRSCSCRCSRRSTRRSARTWAAAPRPGSTTSSPGCACARPGIGSPRESEARDRPRDGARLRPRDHRPAALDLDGLHRGRAGPVLRPASRSALLLAASRGGRRSCSPAPGSRLTGCCARAPSGATATPTRCAKRSATPTTPTGSRSTRRRRRSCGCSAWRPGRSSASARAGASCTSCSGRRRACASGRSLWSLLLVLAANVAVFLAMAAAAADGSLAARPAGHVRERRGRHQHDRVRRALLGARRRRRARRRGAAARARDGAGRRARARHARPPRACPRARSASAT